MAKNSAGAISLVFKREIRNTANGTKRVIASETRVVRPKMVPEIGLHLITEDMAVWNSSFEDSISRSKFHPIFSENEGPFWAVFWPGGQTLARFILDFPNVVKSKRVLDLGCGCGASTIASLMSGCSICEANDVDLNSLAATELNVELNNVDGDRVTLSSNDYLENVQESVKYLHDRFDVILVGDMFFDQAVGDKVSRLATSFKQCEKDKRVYIGDPGRWYLNEKAGQATDNLTLISKHELTKDAKQQNFGLLHGFVYSLDHQLAC